MAKSLVHSARDVKEESSVSIHPRDGVRYDLVPALSTEQKGVLDTNSNVTSVISGPSRYTRQDHERLVCGPSQMIKIPPRHYTTIGSPVVLDDLLLLAQTPRLAFSACGP